MAQPLTAEQLDAVRATGNVLVMAGAGTGKTSTLVERCLAHLLDPVDPVSLDAILMVTFTEAAAAEMRQRLRARLEQQVMAESAEPWMAEQLARLETARISTLHSFCLGLIREHFHELGLDPELSVLPQDQADLLAEEQLEELLQEQLAGTTPRAAQLQSLVLDYARGRDSTVRQLVLQLHHYAQTLTDPDGWLGQQTQDLTLSHPGHWTGWLVAAFNDWRTSWLPELQRQPADHPKAAACSHLLSSVGSEPARGELAAVLTGILALDNDWPRGTKTRCRGPLAAFFADAAFLASLAETREDRDPLVEDWQWVREPMTALLDLAREFGARYAAAKRELAALDFQDLEQLALRLLWDRARSAPTDLARRWRRELRHILVDEVQDINPAQDRILAALAREGDHANRFLVGDVKQSIYRFRLADPRIFQQYARDWAGAVINSRVLTLTANFRSHPAILDFVNQLFARLLHPAAGGLAYTEDQWLRPGTSTTAQPQTAEARPAVELHWIIEARRSETEDDRPATELEARLVARRLQSLMAEGRQLWDRSAARRRPLAWNDIAVLLRSPRTRVETYARVFAALGVPLLAGRGGFYDSLEVSDLVSLLQVLDNPQQDIPLLAVLRSPLAGFTPDDLVCLRIAQRRASLWTALRKLARQADPPAPSGTAPIPAPTSPGPEPTARVDPSSETEAWLASAWPIARQKARAFLDAHGRWRQLSRVTSLSECLETILEETGYEAWLTAQPAPDTALNRVRRLLSLTRTFDQFQRQGLHRFLQFIAARRDSEADVEPAAATAGGAVRLLSVHQSKGLEFPVVVLADLGKRFNLDDLRAPVILDESYGVCPLVQPPGVGRRYPSLPYWLAARRQRREASSEELRLLYVACTRACETLILCGTASRGAVEERWPAFPPELSALTLFAGHRWLDWLGPWWFGRAAASPPATWHARVYEPEDPWLAPPTTSPPAASLAAAPPPAALNAQERMSIENRLSWTYPHQPATREPAKVSVSQLRLRARDAADEAARPLFIAPAPPAVEPAPGIDPAARGTAHHLVMESLPLNDRITQGQLLATVAALQDRGGLTPEAAAVLDLPAILEFWQSDLGERIRRQHPAVHRELPFTGRFTANDLLAVGVPVAEALAAEEFVVVQGVIDLAVLLPDAIWLLDFKTDRVSEGDLTDHTTRYEPQLRLYALAIARIYRRPVTEAWLHFLHLRRSVAVTPPAMPKP